MRIGYARVSTDDQKLHLQRDALGAAGCGRIFEEKISGTSARLLARDELLTFARHGDVVVVWKLDRLGSSLRDLVDFVVGLDERGVEICSLHESIDTGSAAGKLNFHIFAALAELEAALVRERTRAGLAAARSRGITPGRPRRLGPEQIEIARTLLANPKLSARQVAAQLGVHRTTLYRALTRAS